MMKLRSKRFQRSLSKLRSGGGGGDDGGNKECGTGTAIVGEIKWELRPGGMLVQKREIDQGLKAEKEGVIMVRVVTGSQCHDISIQPTSTFGEMKMMLSMVTGMEPKEQRVLYKGKEREDVEHLHMVGVRDNDKVVVLEDPAIKEKKKLLHGSSLPTTNDVVGASNQPITV